MWTFYLAGALTAFSRGEACATHQEIQVYPRRGKSAVPITRGDYMAEAEAGLRPDFPTP